MKSGSILTFLTILGAMAALTALPQQAQVAESALGAPTLTSPPNGATLSTMGPTLEWINPPGTTQYHFTVVPASNDGPGVELHLGAPDTSFTLPPPPTWYGLLPDMTYTWRVRVSDAKTFIGLDDPTWGPWSQTFTFRTPPAAHETILLRSPADGVAIVGLTPTLIWDDSNVSTWYYEVQVSSDPRFGPEAFLYFELRHAAATFPPRSYTIPTAYPLQPNTTYYWRVRSRIQGDGQQPSWTAASSFTTGDSNPVAPTPDPAPAPSSCTWTGTWDTSWNKLFLTQNGTTVSGSYEYDQGKVTGTVTGNQLVGRWSEAPSYREPADAGAFVWTISERCNTFSGTWGYGRDSSAGTWRGTRTSTTAPAPTPTATAVASSSASWAGTWDTDYGVMVLAQTASAVSGSYTWDAGRIEGTTAGGVLRGKWSESPSYQPPSDAGDLEFRMSADGNSFVGTWSYGFGTEKSYRWSGKRRTGGGAATPTATPTSSTPSTTGCSWTGTWNTSFNAMYLTQTGSTVAGTYDWDGGKISATVSGRQISGRWSEAPTYAEPSDAGRFVFTMSADCQSFSGTWGYGDAAMSGGWAGRRSSTTPPGATATPSGSPVVSDCSWTGTWSTNFNAMYLTQTGSTVAGTYDWDGGKISATVSGRQIAGRWSEAPTYTEPSDAGRFVFTMSADCKSFSGTWGYGDASSGSPWNGTRTSATTPAPVATATSTPTPPTTVTDCSWTGTWSTTFNAMYLTQTGSTVAGTYDWDGGKISATVSGRQISGRWSEAPTYTEPSDAGRFVFTMSADCKSFSGTWGYGDASSGSAWNGTRTSTATPAPVATATPAAVTGCSWTGTWSTTFNAMYLTQTGSAVAGTYDWDGGKISATVSGRQISGRWSEAPTYTEPSDAGRFVFTMSADCKSFSGTWGYGDASSGSAWNGTRTSTTAP